MAIRPVFLPSCDSRQLFIERDIEFTWHPGFSVQQKQKSIESLHSRAKSELNIESILEISTKSPIDEGVRSSAFNLLIPDKMVRHTILLSLHFNLQKYSRGVALFLN